MKVWDPVTRELRDVTEIRSDLVDVGTSDTTILSVPSGHTFFLRTINAYNSSTSDITVTIVDGTTDVMTIVVPAGSEKTITNIEGYYFSGNVVARASATGVKLSVGGLRTI